MIDWPEWIPSARRDRCARSNCDMLDMLDYGDPNISCPRGHFGAWTIGALTSLRPITPLDYNDWPFWAKALKLLAKPHDKGIGDVITRTIGPEKSEAFKSWYKATFNKDCGCTGRQEKWNRMYSFNSPM